MTFGCMTFGCTTYGGPLDVPLMGELWMYQLWGAFGCTTYGGTLDVILTDPVHFDKCCSSFIGLAYISSSLTTESIVLKGCRLNNT